MEEEKPLVDTFGHLGQLGHRFLNLRIEKLSRLKTNIYKGLKMPEKGVQVVQTVKDKIKNIKTDKIILLLVYAISLYKL